MTYYVTNLSYQCGLSMIWTFKNTPFADLTFGLEIGLKLEPWFLKLRGEFYFFKGEHVEVWWGSDATLELFVK